MGVTAHERISRIFKPNVARDGLLVVGLSAGLLQAIGAIPGSHDAAIYWSASLDQLYPVRWDTAGAPGVAGFLYPPPLALVLVPLHVLPWPIVQVAWTTVLFGCLWLLAGRLAWIAVAGGVIAVIRPELPGVFGSILGYALNGNIQLLIGVAVVVSFRWPAAWSFPLLTKVGPGIGILWYVARREWGSVRNRGNGIRRDRAGKHRAGAERVARFHPLRGLQRTLDEPAAGRGNSLAHEVGHVRCGHRLGCAP